MAKLKNLFVGCPVLVKGLEEEGPRIVVHIDAEGASICVLSLVTQHHAWYEPDELKLLPFADPEKIRDHFERFNQAEPEPEPEPEPKVGDRFRVIGKLPPYHCFHIGGEVELIQIEEDEIHLYKSLVSGEAQFVTLHNLESI